MNSKFSRILHPPKLIIFNWTGTLIDFGSKIAIQRLRDSFISSGIELDVKLIKQSMGKRKIDQVGDIITKYYSHTGVCKNKVYELFNLYSQLPSHSTWVPNALKTLENLSSKGIKLGSTTEYNKLQLHYQLKYLEGVNELRCYSNLISGVLKNCSFAISRPFPYGVWRVCEAAQVFPINPKNVFKVGNTFIDIEEGKNANCFTIVTTDSLPNLIDISTNEIIQTRRNQTPTITTTTIPNIITIPEPMLKKSSSKKMGK